MAEVNKEPQEVSEQVEEIVRLGTKVEANEFVEKLQEIVSKNKHKAFDRLEFCISKVLDTVSLHMYGVRKENETELSERVSKEESKQKNIEEHELKEYLRLKKKFDRKKLDEE